MGGCLGTLRMRVTGTINGRMKSYTPGRHINFVLYGDFRNWVLKKFYNIGERSHYKYRIKTAYDDRGIWHDVTPDHEFGNPKYVRLFTSDGDIHDFRIIYPDEML